MTQVDPQNNTQFLLYQTEDGGIRIETQMYNESIWLTQEQMSELFGKSKSTINEHIKNIFAEGELIESSVMRKFGNSEFSTKPTNCYNLDVIISVGYRVKSLRGTQFRIWATQRLREYIIKGFTMNDDRLKNAGGGSYFDMKDWITKLDDFLKISDRDLLTHAGKISHEAALKKAHEEYEKFHRNELTQPTEVERHFIEAEKELNRVESIKSKKGKTKLK